MNVCFLEQGVFVSFLLSSRVKQLARLRCGGWAFFNMEMEGPPPPPLLLAGWLVNLSVLPAKPFGQGTFDPGHGMGMGMGTWGNMLPRGGGRWRWRWRWVWDGGHGMGWDAAVPGGPSEFHHPCSRITDPEEPEPSREEKIKKWVARASF